MLSGPVDGNAHWAETLRSILFTVPPPRLTWRAGSNPLNCKIQNEGFALWEETAAQAVVGSIVWAFGELKKPRCLEMCAGSHELLSVCPQLSFFL